MTDTIMVMPVGCEEFMILRNARPNDETISAMEMRLPLWDVM
jgi:hypothetical protein